MIPAFLHRQRPGAMLLLTTLVLGGVALVVVLSVAMRGIGEMGMGIAESRSDESFALADGCLEEGLVRLTLNQAFTGATLGMGNGTCRITVSPSSGTLRTVSAVGERDRWTKRASARVDLSGTRLSVLWWKQDTQ